MRLPLLLTKRLWVWPLVAALALGLVGYWVRTRLEGTMKEELSSRLETLLRADVAALRPWFTEPKYDAQSVAAGVRGRCGGPGRSRGGGRDAERPRSSAGHGQFGSLQKYARVPESNAGGAT